MGKNETAKLKEDLKDATRLIKSLNQTLVQKEGLIGSLTLNCEMAEEDAKSAELINKKAVKREEYIEELEAENEFLRAELRLTIVELDEAQEEEEEEDS